MSVEVLDLHFILRLRGLLYLNLYLDLPLDVEFIRGVLIELEFLWYVGCRTAVLQSTTHGENGISI